jgi:nitroreductase
VKPATERPISAIDAIFVRRSVRAYSPQRLEEAAVRALLDAAVQAPTAMHTEPWAFVVVQDREMLKRYSDLAKGAWARESIKYRDLHIPGDAALGTAFAQRFASADFCIFYDASTLIVICAKPLGPFVTADCWLAAENLMLAAAALGLGSCCIGSAMPALSTPEARTELGIPDDVTPIAPIIVGVPAGSVLPQTRREPDILSWKK